MRRSRALAVAAIATSAFTLAACGGGAGQTTTLNFGYLFGADHHLRVGVLDPWAAEVSQATNDTLQFNIQAGGTLADAATVFDYVRDGNLDAGWSLQGYTPGEFPNSEFMDLPFQFSSATQATKVFWDIYDEFPEVRAEYEDVKILALYAHDVGELFTTDTEVRTPADLAGQVIRAPGSKLNQAIEAMGGSPVDMPGGEVFDALDRGIIDGYMIARTGPGVLDLTRKTKYATSLDFFVGPSFWTMSKKAYDALTPDQRAAIDESAGRELSLRIAENFDKEAAKAVQDYVAEGVEVTKLNQQERAEFRIAVKPVVQDWIDSREKAGVPGQEIVDRVRQLAKKYDR